MISVAPVVITAIKKLFINDLGIEVSNKTLEKFENVGSSVKNRGGDTNNSDVGFTEDNTIHIAGNKAAAIQITRKTYAQIFPRYFTTPLFPYKYFCLSFSIPDPSLSRICYT
jgi:hypothetical protein